MGRLSINNKCYPPTLKMYEGQSLKFSVEIQDFNSTVKDTIDSLELNIFEKIYLNKAIHLFEAQSIEIKDSNEE